MFGNKIYQWIELWLGGEQSYDHDSKPYQKRILPQYKLDNIPLAMRLASCLAPLNRGRMPEVYPSIYCHSCPKCLVDTISATAVLSQCTNMPGAKTKLSNVILPYMVIPPSTTRPHQTPRSRRTTIVKLCTVPAQHLCLAGVSKPGAMENYAE